MDVGMLSAQHTTFHFSLFIFHFFSLFRLFAPYTSFCMQTPGRHDSICRNDDKMRLEIQRSLKIVKGHNPGAVGCRAKRFFRLQTPDSQISDVVYW